jgi:hypothetical protein
LEQLVRTKYNKQGKWSLLLMLDQQTLEIVFRQMKGIQVLPGYFAGLLVVEMRDRAVALVCLASLLAAVPGALVRSLSARDGFFGRQALKHALGPVYVAYYNARMRPNSTAVG